MTGNLFSLNGLDPQTIEALSSLLRQVNECVADDATTPVSLSLGRAEALLLAFDRLTAERNDLRVALESVVRAAQLHACHHDLSVDGRMLYDIASSQLAAIDAARSKT